MRRAWFLVMTLACGRVGFEPIAGDSGTSGADTGDVGPWGPPTPVAELNSGAGDDDPTLTADQLEIYFNSNRSGNEDIWRATRNSLTEPWGVPQSVAELNSTANDKTPEISPDGLTIMFASLRLGGNLTDEIFLATRPNRSSPWSTPMPVVELNSLDSDVAPFVVSDVELIMGRADPTDNKLMRATRSDASQPWSTPVLIAELHSPYFDGDPFVTPDGLTIYWASGRLTNVAFELFTARRSSPADAFVQVETVLELSTTVDEDDPWISPDGHTMYFARGTGAASMRIFVTTR